MPTATPTSSPEPTATPTPTATSTPTAEPPPPTVRLNEVLPVAAPDGIIGEVDEWVELHNAGSSAVDLSGWWLGDGGQGGGAYRIPAGTLLQAGAFMLFDGRTTGIVLDDTGDAVRLLDPDGVVVDEVAFGQLAPNASYSRDEFGMWHADWPLSPGAPNQPLVPGNETAPGRWFRWF